MSKMEKAHPNGCAFSHGRNEGETPYIPGQETDYSRLTHHPAARPDRSDQRARPERRLVDGVFESLASLEAWNLGSFDLDRLASLRVTASARGTVFYREGTEAYQDHGITSFQSTSDGFDHSVQRTTSNSFRDISRCGDSIDQFRLVHSKSPYF